MLYTYVFLIGTFVERRTFSNAFHTLVQSPVFAINLKRIFKAWLIFAFTSKSLYINIYIFREQNARLFNFYHSTRSKYLANGTPDLEHNAYYVINRSFVWRAERDSFRNVVNHLKCNKLWFLLMTALFTFCVTVVESTCKNRLVLEKNKWFFVVWVWMNFYFIVTRHWRSL